MKQDEIITGESYLFLTGHKNKMDFNNSIVTVSGRKQGNKKTTWDSTSCRLQRGRKPMRFKLTNGRYANAAELKPIPANTPKK